MTSDNKSPAGMLSPYRVLDLTDERGLLCGKILADLGADVLQIEPPAGSSARRIAPFYRDEPSPDHSLFWWAYAANKRSITLDVARADGKALLERLVASAHFLIESGGPGERILLGTLKRFPKVSKSIPRVCFAFIMGRASNFFT